jgi:hypothetical protein
MKRRMNMKRRGVTPPPHSPPPEDLSSLGDLFSYQARISVCVMGIAHLLGVL